MSTARYSLPLKHDLEEQQLSFLSSYDYMRSTTQEDQNIAKFANEPEESRSASISPR
jgi:hypothetical protein